MRGVAAERGETRCSRRGRTSARETKALAVRAAMGREWGGVRGQGGVGGEWRGSDLRRDEGGHGHRAQQAPDRPPCVRVCACVCLKVSCAGNQDAALMLCTDPRARICTDAHRVRAEAGFDAAAASI